MRIRFSTTSVGLALIVCLGAGHTNTATASCIPGGLKSLFCMQSSYEKLANYLYTATPSSELEQNTKMAKVMLGEEKDKHSDRLKILALNLITINATSAELLCRRSTMRSVRGLAEHMQRHGNLGPRRITEPVRRLNRLVIQVITEARSMCFEYLGAKYLQGQWIPSLSGPFVTRELARLDKLPDSFKFDGYVARQRSIYDWDEEQTLAGHLRDILWRAEHVNFAGAPRETLEQALKKNIQEPCEVLQTSTVSKAILEPYKDLLLASLIIAPKLTSMAKFYKSPSERPTLNPVTHRMIVLNNAERLQACNALLQLGPSYLAKMMRRAEREEEENESW